MKSFEIFKISFSKFYAIFLSFLVFYAIITFIFYKLMGIFIEIEKYNLVVVFVFTVLFVIIGNFIEKISRQRITIEISKKNLTIDDRNIPLKEISHMKIKTLFINFPFIRIFKKNGEIERIRVVKNANLLDLEMALNEIGLIKR